MDKVTVVSADVSVDYFPQAYTDAAVAAAVAEAVQVPAEVIADVVVENTDGTHETLEPIEAPAVEATEEAPVAE